MNSYIFIPNIDDPEGDPNALSVERKFIALKLESEQRTGREVTNSEFLEILIECYEFQLLSSK